MTTKPSRRPSAPPDTRRGPQVGNLLRRSGTARPITEIIAKSVGLTTPPPITEVVKSVVDVRIVVAKVSVNVVKDVEVAVAVDAAKLVTN
jgi:hypothetical protein